jgi:hypothetical protein
MARTATAHLGACLLGTDASIAIPTHGFACGTMSCQAPKQACTNSQPIGTLPTYSCADIPSACVGNVTCSCVQSALGANQCSETNGEFTLTRQ